MWVALIVLLMGIGGGGLYIATRAAGSFAGVPLEPLSGAEFESYSPTHSFANGNADSHSRACC